MLCYISAISLTILAHLCFYPFSNANPSIDDKMLIAFMKGHPKIQIIEYLKQKHEAHLGILYFMRKNWKCDKIADEFDEHQRTECQKYRKYLDILYEYLYREYVGISTVKPKFVFKRGIEIEGPIIYAVNCLVKISQFYLTKSLVQKYEYKLNKMLYDYEHFEPKLLNEERLNNEFKLKKQSKMPINEMILQLAIETANEWQTNESLDEIILQNFEEKFEEYLQEMFKKAEERAKKDPGCLSPYTINYDKHCIIIYSKFDDIGEWTEDALFLEFVKGLATNSEKFFKMAKEYSNNLCRRKEKGNIYWYKDESMVSFGLYEIEKMKEYLQQKYEAHLGVAYLMRENWHCGKTGEEFKEKCQKYRKYLDILHEYLFRLYAEAKNPKVSKQFRPLVKPLFIGIHYLDSLIKVVHNLNEISKCFWQKGENEMMNVCYIPVIDLVNEEELNYEIKHEKSVEKAPKNEKETKIANLRKEFEQKMKILCENAKENAKEAKEKLEKAISGTDDEKERKTLKYEFVVKFGTFIRSPFS